MGTYVQARIVYGITVEEPDIDWNAPYDENAPEPEPIDYYDLIRPFPLLDYVYGGDSAYWDDDSLTHIIHVRSAEIEASNDDPARPFDPREVAEPSQEALDALAAVASLIDGKKVSEPGWLLSWSRG